VKSFRNFVSLDTRSREIRHQDQGTRDKGQGNLIIRKYLSSTGEEYFISFEDQLGYLYGFARLLLPIQGQGTRIKVKGLGDDIAIIRELHIYGQMEGFKDEKIKRLKD
jgi:histone acetyltransferase (RNA polymerase elongator complex component)